MFPIFPDVKTAAIQKKGGQQPAHTSIAIIEGMDAEEVMDEDGDGNKRLYLCIAYHTVEFLSLSKDFPVRQGRCREVVATQR